MPGTFQELLVFAAEAEKKVRAARLAEGTYTPLQGAQPAQVMLISNGPATTPKGKVQVFHPGLEAFESLLDKRIWAEQSPLDTNGIVLLTQALPDDDKVDALTPASVPMDVNALSIPQQQLVLIATTKDLASRPNPDAGDEDAFRAFIAFIKDVGFLAIKHAPAFTKQFAQVLKNRQKSADFEYHSKCWNCGEIGHKAMQCPKAKVRNFTDYKG